MDNKLGKDIYSVVGGGAKDEEDSIINNFVTSVVIVFLRSIVIVHLNMFRPGVKHRVVAITMQL